MVLHRLAITLLLCLGAAQRARVNPYGGSDSEDLEREIVEVSADAPLDAAAEGALRDTHTL